MAEPRLDRCNCRSTISFYHCGRSRDFGMPFLARSMQYAFHRYILTEKQQFNIRKKSPRGEPCPCPRHKPCHQIVSRRGTPRLDASIVDLLGIPEIFKAHPQGMPYCFHANAVSPEATGSEAISGRHCSNLKPRTPRFRT
jgi:hypothetical protein